MLILDSWDHHNFPGSNDLTFQDFSFDSKYFHSDAVAKNL
jgi:hypothetical protein